MNLSKFVYSLQIRNSIYHQVRQHWQDILIVVFLAAAAGFASYQGGKLINPMLFDKQAGDVWFHSDIGRVIDDMTVYGIDHDHTNVHPLFLLILFPVVYVLKTALLLEPITAVRIVIAVVAGLWFSSLFISLRVIGCRRFDATLFSVLAATSAAAVFWFVVPETYPFGSLSILLALGCVALTQHRKLSPLSYVVVNVLTLSITITNWMVGILATIVNHRRKQFLQITLTAFGILAVLVAVQKVIFPTSNAGGFFFPTRMMRGEAGYMIQPDSGGPLKVVKSFVFDTLVMPAINLVNNKIDLYPLWPIRMSVQMSSPGSGSVWGTIAVVLWIALLSLGLWGLFSTRKHLRLRVVLGLTILGQLALHTVYGNETFLYTLNFLPLLVVLAALSTLTRARLLALVLAGMLVLSAGMNNILQFNQAVAFINRHGSLCAIPSAKCAVDSKIISSP